MKLPKQLEEDRSREMSHYSVWAEAGEGSIPAAFAPVVSTAPAAAVSEQRLRERNAAYERRAAIHTRRPEA